MLASNSPYIDIEQDWSSINFGTIVTGQTIAGSTPFVVSIEQGIPDGVELGLQVEFTDGAGNSFSGHLDIKVSGNDLSAYDVDVIGSASDVLTPGHLM